MEKTAIKVRKWLRLCGMDDYCIITIFNKNDKLEYVGLCKDIPEKIKNKRATLLFYDGEADPTDGETLYLVLE